jgi:beta-exotoxin I transport system ATP-binding protein
MANVIVAERLTKSYGRKRGVIDLDFAVPPAQVFGYLGPNDHHDPDDARPDPPDLRTRRVFGLDARRDSVEIHRRIGYLPGELTCTSGLRAANTSLTSRRSAAGSTRTTPFV